MGGTQNRSGRLTIIEKSVIPDGMAVQTNALIYVI